jgi:hypothetical protein
MASLRLTSMVLFGIALAAHVFTVYFPLSTFAMWAAYYIWGKV